jgi:hypothetical protein
LFLLAYVYTTVRIRPLKGEEEEEKNNELMKMEEEKKKEEAKILYNFPFRLGTHNCARKDIEEERKNDLEEGGRSNGDIDDKM